MEVVLDTSCVLMPMTRVSGNDWIRQEWTGGTITPLVNKSTLDELNKAIRQQRLGITEEQARTAIESYLRHAKEIPENQPSMNTPKCRDETDQPFIDLAYQAQTAALIAEDPDLLSMKAESSVPIMSPREFKRWLENPSRNTSPEIVRLANKSELRRKLESARRKQQPWFIFHWECCGNCGENGFVKNILQDVTAVTTPDESPRLTQPDIVLKKGQGPDIWIDIVAGLAPSEEKLSHCERHNIELFEIDGTAHPREATILKAHIPSGKCGKEFRNSLKEAWHQIEQDPTGQLGIREDFRTEGEKEAEWTKLAEKWQEIRRLAEQGCTRCGNQLVTESGYAFAQIVRHSEQGECGAPVPLCQECDFAVRGGWTGEFPDDHEEWKLQENCETCLRIYREQQEEAQQIETTSGRSLWMPDRYGSRIVSEPRERTQQFLAGEKAIGKQELLCSLATIRLIATSILSPGQQGWEPLLFMVEQAMNGVMHPNEIEGWDWLEGMGESYIPDGEGEMPLGDKFVNLKQFWGQMPPSFPLDFLPLLGRKH